MVKGIEGGRERLLRAADEEFGVSGYADASVAAILERSELKAPSLYHHFGDKEGLYVAWAELSLCDFGERLVTKLKTVDEPFVKLKIVAIMLIDGNGPDPIQIRRDCSQLRRSASAERVYQLLFETLYQPIFGILIELAQNGVITLSRMDRDAHTFVFGAMASHPKYSLQTLESDAAAEMWVRLFIDGVRQRPQGI